MNEIQIKFLFSCWINPDFFTRETLKKHYIAKCSPPYFIISIIGYLSTGIGLTIAIVSIVNLGKSTRMGLPYENTELKTNGLYKFSRNPMYLGFNLLTIASVLILWNVVFLLLGIYSIITYHFIILSEEKYLEKRFTDKYIAYKERVRRYV